MKLIRNDLLDTSVLHSFCMLLNDIITSGRPKDLNYLKSTQILVNSPKTFTFVTFLNSSPPLCLLCVALELTLCLTPNLAAAVKEKVLHK